MALVLHKVMRGGKVVHEPFSQSAWERALRDPSVERRWGHDPADCHDPVERHRSENAHLYQSASKPIPKTVSATRQVKSAILLTKWTK